jgi:hypothetical protein
VATDGPDASALCQAYGYKLDPWQDRVIDAWLGRDAADRFTATSCGLSVPRQNGKNALLEVRELYGSAVIGEKILHTAHEVKTARKAFERLAGFFSNERLYPELADMVKYIRRANGQEAIVLENGGSIEFSARSRGAARGFTVDVVVFDEAQELTDEQLEAILPTLAAAPLGNRQFIYTGTPPSPSSPGTVLARKRDAAIADLEANDIRHDCWQEWSVDRIGDVTDRDRWYEANPALGYRLEEDFCADECRSMSPDGFARERLGWWSETGKLNIVPVIDSEAWAALEIEPESVPENGKTAYGVKFAPDGRSFALSVALVPAAGPAHVELVGVYANTDAPQVAARLVARRDGIAEIALDGRNGADPMAQRLEAGGMPRRCVHVCTTSQAIASVQTLVDAVANAEITHIESPALDESATKTTRRRIGTNGAYGFGDTPLAESAPVESAALALWAARTCKRDPRRRSTVR